MKTNEVLALKYRPKRFEDLVGQESISTTLSLALDTSKLSNVYLFSGLRGSGKTSTARILAKSLVCQNAPTSKPCEICNSCLNANENRHLDIIEIDAASNRGIDDIKTLIENTKYQPTSSKYKVFIIDEVHMLTPQAFNALLKTLEEPPSYIKFILATTDPLKIPATILSRTQHFRFKKIASKDIKNHLIHILNIENISFEEEALDIIVRSGQGSLRDTLTLLNQAIVYSKNNIDVLSITSMMGMVDPKFMSDIFQVVLNKGDITNIIHKLETYESEQILDEMSIYLKQAMLGNDHRFQLYMFDRFFRILSDAKELLRINCDGEFVLILTFFKLSEAISLKPIQTAIDEIQDNIKIDNSKKDIPITNDTIKPIVKKANLYDSVIKKVYNRSEELGKCFENSFEFHSYDNNTLTINSSASGDCKALLYKHFAKIREFIEDIYGDNTDIKFNKLPIKQEPIKDIKEANNDNSTTTKEKNIDDILNSPIVTEAYNIFKVEEQIILKK